MIEKVLIAAVILFGLILIASALTENILAPILALLHEKFNKRFGFPKNVKTGEEGLLNQIAIVKTEFVKEIESGAFKGQVFVKGELWQAKINMNHDVYLKPGDKVKVININGLWLDIEPVV